MNIQRAFMSEPNFIWYVLITFLIKLVSKISPRTIVTILKFRPARVIHPQFNEHPDFDYRLKENSKSKAKIASMVTFQLLPSIYTNHNEQILLDSGSVTYNIAFQMFTYRFGKILTNNHAIMMLYMTFARKVPHLCRCLGGELIPDICANAGKETTAEAVRELTGQNARKKRTRIAVLGLRAYSDEQGLAEDTPMLSDFQAAMIRHAQYLIIVAQGEKFLKPTHAPIFNSKEFRKIIAKRTAEKRVWFVYHPVVKFKSITSKAYYEYNLRSFIKLLPADQVFDASSVIPPQNLII